MNIGNLQFSCPVFSAPMAGISDKAFRIIAREFGCELCFTEMVSDKAILHNNSRTKEIYNTEGERQPVGVQLFGSHPGEMARAAEIIEKSGAAIIDINMGCPTPKIVKNNEGAALMLDPSRAEKIVREVVKAVSVPVTVKMRKGWDEASVNCVEIAARVEEAGAKAVTIHGRTREQFYAGKADWSIIAEVVKAINIPVVGNGDVFSGEDAKRMIEYTGCSGVMIARGSLGNPWIFQFAREALSEKDISPLPSPLDKITMAKKHLCLAVKFKGERIAVKEMRKHLAWYFKGLKNASRMRKIINTLENIEDVIEVLDQYKENLKNA